MSHSWRQGLKPLGAGIGLRREFHEQLPRTARALDWVEFVSENFLTLGGRAQWALDACAERWPVIPHGVGLDIGGPEPLNEDYMTRLAALVERVNSPFFSDHLCYARLGGVYLHDLLPLPFSEEAVEHVVPRVREVMARVERPFLLENITYYARMPGRTLSEAAFLRAVVEEADCGLLLDVNNVYVNARNHGYDPRAFLDALPLERVVQVHLAGHTELPDMLIDSHGDTVRDEVWSLYQYLLERTGPVSTLIEWDQDIPSLEAVLDEADRARAVLGALGER
ncbi:DUF692 domain-containing protein [Cystobacter fuscus]|uniref:MNIO family bufferin maturase n=1 Tax=Cystobacter fuscus TaxID=43 RepID=UPI002B2A3CD3|nr:DUF692 domain-containing protein [Cystobacter fuscus]